MDKGDADEDFDKSGDKPFENVFAKQEKEESAEAQPKAEAEDAPQRQEKAPVLFFEDMFERKGPPAWKFAVEDKFGGEHFEPAILVAPIDGEAMAAPAEAAAPRPAAGERIAPDEGAFFKFAKYSPKKNAAAGLEMTALKALPDPAMAGFAGLEGEVKLEAAPVVEEDASWRDSVLRVVDFKIKSMTKTYGGSAMTLPFARDMADAVAQAGADHFMTHAASTKQVTEIAPQSSVSFTTPAQQASHVASQVGAAIRSNGASSTIEVRLDPPDLGRVRIEFAMDTPDAVKAVVSAERPDTLDHMRRHASHLIDELKFAGFGDVNLEFSQYKQSSENDAVFDHQGAVAMDEQTVEQSAVTYLKLNDPGRLDLLV